MNLLVNITYILTMLVLGGAATGTTAPATSAAGGTTTTASVTTVPGTAVYLSGEIEDLVPGSTWNDDIRVIYPVVLAKNRLLVVLPDFEVSTSVYGEFEVICGRAGLHVIVLAYPNTVDVITKCQLDERGGCITKAVEEVVTGQALSSVVEVTNVADGIEQRLKASLLRMKNSGTYGSTWAQYLDASDNVIYDNVGFVGVGLGASFAGFLAKKYILERVILVGGPLDLYDDGSDVTWLASASATPADRYYSFFQRSSLSNCEVVTKNTDKLGVLSTPSIEVLKEVKGEPDTVQDFVLPQPRRVCSYNLPRDASGTAGLMQANLAEKYTDNSPIVEPAWSYLVGTADPSVTPTIPDSSVNLGDCSCVASSIGTTEIVIIVVCAVIVIVVGGGAGIYCWRKRKRSDGF